MGATSHLELSYTAFCQRASVKPGKVLFKLPPEVNSMTNNVIKDFFQVSYGTVIKLKKYKKLRKGKEERIQYFCQITFESEKVSEEVIKLGHVSLNGFKLEVYSTRNAQTGLIKTEAKCRKLFVGGLKIETTEENLINYFRQFGEVEEVELTETKKSSRALVTFK